MSNGDDSDVEDNEPEDPAFPQPITYTPDGDRDWPSSGGCGLGGITIRDYFAARAMQALAEDVLINQATEDKLMKEGLKPDEFPAFLANFAYNVADAMLERRKS